MFVVGDFNVKTGNELTPNPNGQVSKAGRFLIYAVKDTDLERVNGMDINSTTFTHVDRSSNTSNVLDYVFTNSPDLVDCIDIDGGFTRSPHYTRL